MDSGFLIIVPASSDFQLLFNIYLMVKKSGRGRPKRETDVIRVTIRATPKLIAYLDDLIKAEGYGKTRPGAVENACWRFIEEMKGKGIIKDN